MRKKRKGVGSEIDFAAIMGTVANDESRLPYEENTKSYQREIKKAVMLIFDQHNVTNKDDYIDILNFIRKDVGESVQVVNFAEAIGEQLDSLSLPQRNNLHILLTHRNGQVNDDMLAILPSLRQRSTILMEKTQRKIREDKIDLSLITSFMHDYCR